MHSLLWLLPKLTRPHWRWFCPLPTAPCLGPCPSPSAPAHRAGRSPGPSSPSDPLRSGETKAAVSQSGAGRPPPSYPGLLMSSPGNSTAPPTPLPKPCLSPGRVFWAPSVPLREALTCRPAGEKSHCSGAALGQQPSRPTSSGSPTSSHGGLPALQTRAAPGACSSLFPSIRSALPLTWAFRLTARWTEVCGL